MDPKTPIRKLALLLLCSLASCIHMVGQRIVLTHDEKADQLEILLFSEGIYVEGTDRKLDEATKEFLNNAGFVVLGWPFQIDKQKLRESLEEAREEEKEIPAEVEDLVEALVANYRTVDLGRYLDHEGRISLAQRVVIFRVSQVLASVNRAINAGILAAREKAVGSGEWAGVMREAPATKKLVVELARAGNEWLYLEGCSLVCDLPVNAGEWRSHGVPLLAKALELKEKALSGPVWSHEERLDQERPLVRFRLGFPERSIVLRFYSVKHARAFDRKLLEPIRSVVRRDWDAMLRKALLGRGRIPGRLRDLLSRLPVEEKVRALLRDEDEASAPQRLELLAKLAREWNASGSKPPAPTEQAGDSRKAWLDWYRRLVEGGHPF